MEQLISLDDNSLQTFIDNPESIITQDIPLQITLASHLDTPRNLLEILADSDNPEVAEAAQMHVNYAGELKVNWQDIVDEKLKSRYLGQNDKLAVELLKIAPVPPYFLSEYVPAEYLIQGLNNPHLPLRYCLQLLARLAQEPTLEPRLQVAESPDTPLAVLKQLIGDLELSIRIAVEYNPNCPSELVELVKGQYQVASNWDTDSQQLENLSNSNWDWIRLTVAQNPSTSEETLLKLAGDKVFKIQLAVAKNPITSARILAVLAEHHRNEIQKEVATHPNATEEILHSLFDTQQGVIKSRKNLPASILERFYQRVNKSIALSPDYQLRNQYSAIRRFLLQQPNTPAWILAEFADVDVDEMRKAKLANRSHQPKPKVLEKWIQDDLRFLIDIAKHPQVSVEILEQIIQYPNIEIKLAVAHNRTTPEEIKLKLLEELAMNSDYKIKTEIAKNLKTPIYLLEQLGQDEFYQPKLLKELRRVLASEYPEQARQYEGVADELMSQLKHQILYPGNIPVDVERWIEIIQNSSIWEIMTDDVTKTGMYWSKNYSVQRIVDRTIPQWKELLSELSENSLKQVLIKFSNILGLIKDFVKTHQFMRSVAVALIVNPNTPVDLREQLKNDLIRPNSNLHSRYDSDRDVITALAYNTAIPESERKEYFEQLLSIRNNESLARNPDTPPEILLQIMSQPGTGRQAVSRNPNAPHSALEELAKDENRTTRNWVAENPGTPSHILMNLARDSDNNVIESALKNPNLPILNRYKILLEQEKQRKIEKSNQILAKKIDSPYALAIVLETGDQNIKLSLARNSQMPIKILEQLAKDEDEMIRQTIAQNPSISKEIAEQLAQDKSIKVQLSLLRSKIDLSPEILHQLSQSEDRSVRLEIAKNRNTPPIILRYLVFDKKCQVEVLKNPATPADILAEYIPKITNEKQIESVLRGTNSTQQKNPNMPSEILEQLSHHSKDTIRYLVALYPNASSTTLKHLASDSYRLVREAVAENPNTPPDILVEMAKASQNQINTTVGSAHSVAYKIAARKDIPAEALYYLVKIPVSTVRLAAVRNSNISLEALEWLIDNEAEENVLSVIAQNSKITPQIQEKLASNSSAKVRQNLASNPNTTSDNLTIIALTMITEATNLEVQKAVASHPNTPINFLENLSEAINYSIRASVASNPNAPQYLIEKLAQDESVEVCRAVANNPNVSESIRNSLKDLLPVTKTKTQSLSPSLRGISRIYNPDTDDLPTVLSQYINSDVPFVRFVSLLHPLTPKEILENGANSISWIERYAVADNTNTPTEIKQQLTQDSNQIVRAVAICKLAT